MSVTYDLSVDFINNFVFISAFCFCIVSPVASVPFSFVLFCQYECLHFVWPIIKPFQKNRMFRHVLSFHVFYFSIVMDTVLKSLKVKILAYKAKNTFQHACTLSVPHLSLSLYQAFMPGH